MARRPQCEREPDADADFKLVAFIISAMLNNKTKTTAATASTLAQKVGRGFKKKRAEQSIDYYVKKGKIKRTPIDGSNRFVLSLVLPDRSPAEVFSKAPKEFLKARNDWLTAIMLDTRLTVGARVAAYGLAAYLDHKTFEISNESCEVLADWTVTSEKTTRRAIEALHDAGWLDVSRSPGKAITMSPKMPKHIEFQVPAREQGVQQDNTASAANPQENIANPLHSGSEPEIDPGATLDSGVDSGVDNAKPIIVQNQWLERDHPLTPFDSLKVYSTGLKKTGGAGFSSRVNLGTLMEVVYVIENSSKYDDRIHIGVLTGGAGDHLSILLNFARDLQPLINFGFLKKSNAKGGQSGELNYLQVTDAGFAAVRDIERAAGIGSRPSAKAA